METWEKSHNWRQIKAILNIALHVLEPEGDPPPPRSPIGSNFFLLHHYHHQCLDSRRDSVFNVYFSVVKFWLSSHIWLFRLVSAQLISQLIDARCRQRTWQPQRAVQPRHKKTDNKDAGYDERNGGDRRKLGNKREAETKTKTL
ncbi:hypothetical protein EYF80_012635 [Liparis tanakae]|uniref:Uncharacterized protein n=1 Tax=Liparis tanakae TaxID=230148 RepID=A0A4Z2IGT5_9TELE|nr:hypothetical protein EYF80_012635 [Liparis tanakae]